MIDNNGRRSFTPLFGIYHLGFGVVEIDSADEFGDITSCVYTFERLLVHRQNPGGNGLRLPPDNEGLL